jgi:signal transduction histidine kinase
MKNQIYNARVSPIWGADGVITGMVIIFRDVTTERQLDAAKNEFISTSAHELRTPLTSIRGFSEILIMRDDISKEEAIKFLKYINRQAVLLGDIINDLLDISRIESGDGYKLNRSEFSLDEMVEGEISPFREMSGKINFIVKPGNKPGRVYADAGLLSQALRNLISNSVKYSPLGGDILIRWEVGEENFSLSVEDHGMGMTSVQKERIFDKFYRADSTNTAIEGTGLGMSIVKNIIEAHNGTIDIKSEIDVGTVIKISIPVDRKRGRNSKDKNNVGGNNEKDPGS